MSDSGRGYREAVVLRAREGGGTASVEARRAAFDNRGVGEPARALVDKIARCAWTVTDQDVAGAREAGVSEDEIFEFAVCAALGQATRQLDAALAALDAATAHGAATDTAPRRTDGGRR